MYSIEELNTFPLSHPDPDLFFEAVPIPAQKFGQQETDWIKINEHMATIFWE